MNRPNALLLLLALSLLLTVRLKHQARSTRPKNGTVRKERNGLVFDDAYEGVAYGDDHRSMIYGDDAAAYRRSLLSTLENPRPAGDGLDHDAAFAAQYQHRRQPGTGEFGSPRPPPPPLEPYTLEDAVREADAFESTFAVFVYDPPSDEFFGLYSDDHKWKQSNSKLFLAMNNLAYLLRRLFPERFTPSSPELVLAIASGDFPQVKISALPRSLYASHGGAPVLMFGSSFRDESLYPNMVAMPMPEEHHLLCFQQWVSEGTLCQKLKANTHAHGNLVGLEFGEENGLGWDDLIPQLVWRGSDFCYLPTLTRPRHIKPYAYKPRAGEDNRKESAVKALRDNYDSLSPRWKGVALSGEAALEAESTNEGLPWANMKFLRSSHQENAKFYLESNETHALRGSSIPEEDLVRYDITGISVGEYLPSSELVKYKYHTDLGGGGGTTWSGTVQKLAMPGLLFHHVTPMKDYIHDRLVPWRHYVPVSHDLRDLRSKVRWAERHPWKAKWIAAQGAAFMRHVGSEAGFDQMFQEDLVEPLRRAVEAYRPVETTHPGMTWRDVLGAIPGGDKMKPIAECGGTSGTCHPLDAYREEVTNNQYGIYRSS